LLRRPSGDSQRRSRFKQKASRSRARERFPHLTPEVAAQSLGARYLLATAKAGAAACFSLRDAGRNNRPLMIKMAVEGYEAPVVHDAKNSLAGTRNHHRRSGGDTQTTRIFARSYNDPFRRSYRRRSKVNGICERLGFRRCPPRLRLPSRLGKSPSRAVDPVRTRLAHVQLTSIRAAKRRATQLVAHPGWPTTNGLPCP
jgi:hypothetical protein